MVGKGCRHVAFVSDIAQKDTLVNVDRLIWKASQVRGQISKRNWISISRLERGTMARWCFSWAWNLIYTEHKLEKKKPLCILRAEKAMSVARLFSFNDCRKKKMLFCQAGTCVRWTEGLPILLFPWQLKHPLAQLFNV